MKYITRIVITRQEVPDGYQVADVSETSGRVEIETEGNMYLSFRNKDTFSFVNMNPDFEELSPINCFVHWSSIAWLGFADRKDTPEKLREFLFWFRDIKEPMVNWAIDLQRQRALRKLEINTRQVNMKRWDSVIFETNRSYFSQN